MVPYESFLSEKPVITTTDAGGPLDIVADRNTGLVVAPDPSEIARAAAWLREHVDQARAFGRAGKAIAEEVTWDRASTGCSREGRLLLPDAAGASGIADYSALLVPGCGNGSSSRSHGTESSGRRGAPICLYHVGNNPDAHAWIVDALRRRPGLVVLHDFVLHHLVAGLTLGGATATATSTRWSASTASSGGCSRTASSTSGSRRCGRTGPRTSRSRARCSARDRRSSSTPATSRTAPAPRATRGRSGVVPHPAWPVPDVQPGRASTGDPLSALRAPEREQARPAAARSLRARPRATIWTRRCSSSARPRPGLTSTADCSGSDSTAPG